MKRLWKENESFCEKKFKPNSFSTPNSMKSFTTSKSLLKTENKENFIKPETKPKVLPNIYFNENTIKKLAKDVIPGKELDEEVVQLLWQMGDHFLNETIGFAAKLAELRKGTAIDVRDLGLALDRRWNMQFPELCTGFEKKTIKTKICRKNLNKFYFI